MEYKNLDSNIKQDKRAKIYDVYFTELKLLQTEINKYKDLEPYSEINKYKNLEPYPELLIKKMQLKKKLCEDLKKIDNTRIELEYDDIKDIFEYFAILTKEKNPENIMEAYWMFEKNIDKSEKKYNIHNILFKAIIKYKMLLNFLKEKNIKYTVEDEKKQDIWEIFDHIPSKLNI